MKPLIHCKSSVRRWGGTVDDYMKFHEWFDQTKAHVADMRHRAILHNAFGIYLLQQQFGHYFTNADGAQVSVRDVGEQHVLEDLGTIPSLDKCFQAFPFQPWLGGPVRRRKTIDLGALKRQFNIVD